MRLSIIIAVLASFLATGVAEARTHHNARKKHHSSRMKHKRRAQAGSRHHSRG